ncbi:MAG: NAD(P)-binding domain-containing protein [[Clostridium] innocuum]
MKQNIGFIGFGNMAQAMADGMLASGIVKGRAAVCLCQAMG